MKANRWQVFSLLAALMLVALAQTALAAEKWNLIDENDFSSFYFDKNGTTAPKPGVARIKTRAIYTDEGKADALKSLHSSKGLEKLFESDYVYDIDCDAEQSKLLSVTHLDDKGGVIKSSNLGSYTGWEEIPAGSRLSYVEEQVCPE